MTKKIRPKKALFAKLAALVQADHGPTVEPAIVETLDANGCPPGFKSVRVHRTLPDGTVVSDDVCVKE